MKRNLLNFRKLFLLATAALLLFANVANTQTERSQSGEMKSADVVNAKSSALDLKTVGKEVAPGVLEVDPNAIRGKRLVFPRGNQTARIICIGKWKNGECKGIYIEW
ncbi:MAG: hypothetical protein AB1631_17120 [Acidobacteriota bacterium]